MSRERCPGKGRGRDPVNVRRVLWAQPRVKRCARTDFAARGHIAGSTMRCIVTVPHP